MNTPLLKDDPELNLPAAVRAAAQVAEQFHQAYRDVESGEGAAQEPQESQAESAMGDPAPVTSEVTFSPTTEEPSAEPPTVDQPPQEGKPTYEQLEARLSSMTGRFRKAESTIADLRQVIAAMNAAPSPASAPVELSELQVNFSDEELADYGPDFLALIEKKAKAALAPIISDIAAREQELARRVDALASGQAQTVTERMQANLDQRVPEWRVLNNDQNFLAWLDLHDAFSGAKRIDMLRAAYAQGDTPRVAAFFEGFLSEEAAKSPGKAASAKAETPKPSLSDFAAPGRARATASDAAPVAEPQTITRAQIQQFYADVAAGKYRGAEAEQHRLEAMIFEAQRNGRIR